MPRPRVVRQDAPQPAVSVAAADAPDGRPVAPQAAGDLADALPGGDGQDDPGVLDLEPGQATVVCDELQERGIRFREGQWARLPTTHEGTSAKGLPPP
jgi:hypothetical protein